MGDIVPTPTSMLSKFPARFVEAGVTVAPTGKKTKDQKVCLMKNQVDLKMIYSKTSCLVIYIYIVVLLCFFTQPFATSGSLEVHEIMAFSTSIDFALRCQVQDSQASFNLCFRQEWLEEMGFPREA